MRKRRFRKLALWINGIVASLFVIPGILSICSDINGDVKSWLPAFAEEETFYYAEFENKTFENPNISSDIVYATIVAKAQAESTITVEYQTYSVNAIEGIDYIGGKYTEKFTFGGIGEEKRSIAFKSLLTNETKEKVATNHEYARYDWAEVKNADDAGYYGRHFKVKILKITVVEGTNRFDITPENDLAHPEYKNSHYSCYVYLPYEYRVNTYFNYEDSRQFGGEKNVGYYSRIYARMTPWGSTGTDPDNICDGVRELDGKKNWYNWEKSWYEGGTAFISDYGDDWPLINSGLVKVYGTVFSRSIDTAGWHSNSKIHFFWGNEAFMQDHYKKFGETKNNDWNKNYPDLDKYLGMYIKVDPEATGGYKLNGTAVNYLSEGKNPNSKDDDLINVTGGPTWINPDRKRLTVRLGGSTIDYVGKEGALINTTFMRMYPYNGSLGIGLALYNSNKEVDIEARDFYSYITLVDDTAPYVKEEYAEYDKEGNIKLFLRFSEAVYPIKQKPILAKVNNVSYVANYYGGYFSDTLVYEIPAEKLKDNHQKIKTITYTLPEKDIADLAWTFDNYGNGKNNMLIEDGLERNVTIIGDVIDLSIPHLGVDIDQSKTYKNVYDIILSANSTSASKEFTEGTVYYTWDQTEKWSTLEEPKDPNDPANYEYTHVLTAEEKGQFPVKLVNVPTGIYWLHALAVPDKGGREPVLDARTFGPYYYDNQTIPASLSVGNDPGESTPVPSSLKTKYYNLTLGQKEVAGSTLDTIEIVYEYKNTSGTTSTISKKLVDKGEIIPSLNKVVKKYNNNIYTYYSNIDISSTIPFDKDIQSLLVGDVSRIDLKAYFVVTDKAGNRTITNSVDVSYDIRDNFAQKVTMPSSYVKQPRFTGIDYDVYVYQDTENITFAVDPSDTDTLTDISKGAIYSVTVNGVTYEAPLYSSSISDIPFSSGVYVISSNVTGGDNNANLVGENVVFCLTHGLDDMTTNRIKTQEDMVLTNETYQLKDALYYYYHNGSNQIRTMNYGATPNPSTGSYEGGSPNPTFSSSAAAIKYVKYMEKQDLYLIKINENIASLLNSGQGSTTYVMAEGETPNSARSGQLWIRYKKKTWNKSSYVYNWAFYFYRESGEESDGINPNALSKNLEEAIDIVSTRIVSSGGTRYLVDSETMSPTTGAPELGEKQLHAYPETVTQTMSGSLYAGGSYTSEGDMNIYQNSVKVQGISYPLATNMVLSVSDTTSLYYYYHGSTAGTWNKLNAKNGDLLGRALAGDRGIYTIKEYDQNGVSTFDVYIDHVYPIITAYIDGDYDTPYILPDSRGITTFTGKTFTISTLTDIDHLAYVAVFSYPQRVLKNVYYASDFAGNKSYTLTDGNFYVQVGDRSGNVTTYTVILSQTALLVEAAENASKTGVRVKVSNRDEKEIYSYVIYINGELKYTEYSPDKTYTDTGIYRIIVSDIYGNTESRTIVHEAPAPEVTWYYYVDDTPIAYDPAHESRMVITTDQTNPRLSYISSSSRARANFNIVSGIMDDISFEVIGLEDTEYQYSPTGKSITFNTLKNWRLRLWYSKTPESDRVYIFRVDNKAPVYSANFVGSSYTPKVEYEGDKVKYTSTFDIIDWDKYPKVGDVITLDYLDYLETGTTLLPFENGDSISGTQITIRISDESGVDHISVSKNGVVIDNPKYEETTGTLLISSYGDYVITATDVLGNVSTFSFSNIEQGLASGYIDDSTTPIAEREICNGHDNLVIKTHSIGTELILIKYGDQSYTYELHFDGNVLTYGRYTKHVEIVDDEEVPFAEYVETIGFALVVDSVSKNTWHSVIDTTSFVLEALFDNERNVSYRISVGTSENDLYIESLFSVGKGRLPAQYIANLSKKISKIAIYSGDQEIVEGEGFYINVSKTLTIKTDGYDTDITEVKYSFSPLGIVKEYKTIFDGHSWTPFVGEEKGYYQIVVTNKYGNVKTYNLKKIDTFGFVIRITTMDDSDVYYQDQRHVAYSNKIIRLIVMSDGITFYVNGIKAAADYEHDAMVLTLTREGQYHVVAISDNGISEEFDFEIFDDDKFIYQEGWITGFSEKALMKDYTNTPCDVHVGDGVAYIDVSINGTLHKLYDAINANPDIETESLEGAIGRYGNGEYKVGFRNKYGDLFIKSVFYSNTPSLTLERKTTNDPNTFTSYDMYTALNRGFYSNYVLRFSTKSQMYKFTINGEEFKLDEPRTLEFSNISGTGSFSYDIGFNDEYGNDVTFKAILYREDVTVDLSKMRVVVVGNDNYTKDNIAVMFANNLNGIVSINDGDYKRYVSGYEYYADGKYTFVITDVAGNRYVYTINHKSVNHYSLVDPNNNNSEVLTDGVVNYSTVVFNSQDDCYLKHVFKNGELIEDYPSRTFNSTGHWELLIEDAIGNQSYESFYILNNELARFEYNTPYDYVVTEVWKVESEDSRKLLPITGVTNLVLDENGSYAVVVTSTKTTSSFNFTVAINDAPPTAKLVGAEDGGVTARDVRLTGLNIGDVVKVYKNGVLVEMTTITAAKNSPTINSSGKYRIEITNIQGVTTEYEFTRKPIASASASVFIVITCVIAMAGLTFGLIYHTKLKTDE